jgi:hypothetical protein
MLYPAEHELASLLAAWPAAEDRITHLYELDPTHVPAPAGASVCRAERAGARESRSPLPFCLLSEDMPAAPLLELDPVHLYAR